MMLDPLMPEAIEEAPLSQLPLRERKFARTKLALLEATLERLREKRLADITVRELCDAAEVSEATFFNYFKKKHDLLRYFIQIWNLEASLVATEKAGADGGVDYIGAIFEHTGQRIADNPRVMLEIIGHMAQAEPEEWSCEQQPLGTAERLQAFPDVDGVAAVEECEMDNMFRSAIERAKTRGELPAHVNTDAAVAAVIAIFFGIPLWHAALTPEAVPGLYASSLKTLWAGLGV
jgi:AcrR family transcriptional regulator